MKITEVEVSMGRTVKIGVYESFRCNVAMKAEFDGDYSDEKYEELRAAVYKKLQLQIARILPD